MSSISPEQTPADEVLVDEARKGDLRALRVRGRRLRDLFWQALLSAHGVVPRSRPESEKSEQVESSALSDSGDFHGTDSQCAFLQGVDQRAPGEDSRQGNAAAPGGILPEREVVRVGRSIPAQIVGGELEILPGR